MITTFGGRGISIFKQNAGGSIEKVRETGGEFERILSQQPNANLFFNGENAFGTFDSRSDNKGPEPEGIDIGVIDGHTYAFVTLERAGGVMIYDIDQPGHRDLCRLQAAATADRAALCRQRARDGQIHQRGRQPDRHRARRHGERGRQRHHRLCGGDADLSNPGLRPPVGA